MPSKPKKATINATSTIGYTTSSYTASQFSVLFKARVPKNRVRRIPEILVQSPKLWDVKSRQGSGSYCIKGRK
jgi:hypothetical protein